METNSGSALDDVVQGLGVADAAAIDEARELVPRLVGQGDLEPIVEFLVADASGVVVSTLAGRAAPDTVAELCARAFEAGAQDPDIAVTGMAAALLKERIDLLGSLMPHLSEANPQQLTKLAGMAERKAHTDVAQSLFDLALDVVEPAVFRP